MEASFLNKRKIFNDPVYGFINIPNDLIFDIIEHPYFQRLRRIKQLGLTHLVYPGALNTRFNHAIGVMGLMTKTLAILKTKGIAISAEEEEAATIAVLLHDIGHGPFSHALEHSIVVGMTHEDLSHLFMNRLNQFFSGKLGMALEMFHNTYHKKWFHQLIAGQLDLDRIDYLRRDSFFTGVSEGIIGSERIIKMLNVKNDELMVEAKGIYSIEKFIMARSLMYWQVYLHKTVLAAEHLLINILRRAKYLAHKGERLFATPALETFLYNGYSCDDFRQKPYLLDRFAELDDFDILTSIKVWMKCSDNVLSRLSHKLVNRKLFRIEIGNEEFGEKYISDIKHRVKENYNLTDDECDYFVFTHKISNDVYNPKTDKINILFRDGTVKDITQASDQMDSQIMAKPIIKYFLCYPKNSI